LYQVPEDHDEFIIVSICPVNSAADRTSFSAFTSRKFSSHDRPRTFRLAQLLADLRMATADRDREGSRKLQPARWSSIDRRHGRAYAPHIPQEK
jgi:hypothetical protein